MLDLQPRTSRHSGSASPHVQWYAFDRPSVRQRQPRELRPKHMRPVSAMAIDTLRHQANLYTAGRDGIVCVWDLGHGGEEELPRYRKKMRLHREAITDVKLCDNNQMIATCSSDRTIKAWQIDTSYTAHEIGAHHDFVKALAPAHDADTLASCSLDKSLCLWDLRETRHQPLWRAHTASSLYTITSNRSGSLLVTGGYDRVVRGWDPRMRDMAFQLVGHDDVVRSMTMSSDGRTLLSAASDHTVRMWSIGEQRKLHKFTHHNASVWCVASHDDLSTFYSGDRDGYLCKVDTFGASRFEDAECVVLAREQCDVAGRSAGILSLAPHDGHYVWTSNTQDSAIRRWRDVPPKSQRVQLQAMGQFSGVPTNAIVDLRLADTWAASEARTTGGPAHINAKPQAYQVAEDATPLSLQPTFKLPGFCGLLRALMLNDRIHALTIDMGGVVALWNVVSGTCRGTYAPLALRKVAASEKKSHAWSPLDSPGDTLEMVQSLVEGEGASPSWCSLNTSTGVLSILIDEDKVSATEVYLTDLSKDPYAAPWSDEKVQLGVYVLRQLFRRFVSSELAVRSKENSGQPLLLYWLHTLQLTPEGVLKTPLSQLPYAPDDAGNITLQSILACMSGVDDSHEPLDIPERDASETTMVTQTLQLLHALQANASALQTSTSPASPTSFSSGFFGLQRGGVRRSMRKSSSASTSTADRRPDMAKLASANLEDQAQAVALLLREPRPKSLAFDQNLLPDDTIVELGDGHASKDDAKVRFSGKVGTMDRDMPLLEILSPLWLLRPILSPAPPERASAPVKVNMQAFSAEDGHSSTLPSLPPNQNVFSTSRMTRIARLAEHVYHTLAKNGHPLPPVREGATPLDVPLEILCNGEAVPPLHTVAQCQAHYWKNSASVMTLQYRRRS